MLGRKTKKTQLQRQAKKSDLRSNKKTTVDRQPAHKTRHYARTLEEEATRTSAGVKSERRKNEIA